MKNIEWWTICIRRKTLIIFRGISDSTIHTDKEFQNKFLLAKIPPLLIVNTQYDFHSWITGFSIRAQQKFSQIKQKNLSLNENGEVYLFFQYRNYLEGFERYVHLFVSEINLFLRYRKCHLYSRIIQWLKFNIGLAHSKNLKRLYPLI